MITNGRTFCQHPKSHKDSSKNCSVKQVRSKNCYSVNIAVVRLSSCSHISDGPIFWCFLQGWHAQLDLWRYLRTETLGGFTPVEISDQGVYKRLATSGVAAIQRVFELISTSLFERLDPLEDWTLAPFASAVLALDESRLDQVGRWLSGLRDLPVGDPGLLAGRLSCLFDVRRQQWVRVDVLPQATGNSLLEGLLPQTLLLFDLGYFSFEWLDELTRRGFFWVSRLRERGSYQMQHILIQKDGYLDAILFLGAYRVHFYLFSLSNTL